MVLLCEWIIQRLTYDQIKINGKSVKNVDMVAPYSQQTYPFKGAHANETVQWTVVNDYGGDQKGESILH